MSNTTNTSVLRDTSNMSAEQIREVELECQREELQIQYRKKLRLLELKRHGARIVYANQESAAMQIIQQFMLGKVWVALVAPPGAGKTGVILEVLRQLGQHSDIKHQIHTKDMLVITGMSDTDWTKTMKDGMLPALENTVHHRAMLRGTNVSSMENGIIVTDECHVAAQQNQTIDKKLKEAGLKSIETLRLRNMRMLDVSATPEGVLADLTNWREHTALVVLQPDEKYKGFQTMKDEGRLLNAKDYDMDKYEDAEKFLKLLDARYARCPTKKYFAFRISSPTARGNINTACKQLGWAEPQNHDSSDRVEDIDAVMDKAPEKHKVFFVKGFWRASKRLVRKHVGATYEAPTIRPDDTSKSQGLTARFCNTFDWEGEQLDTNLRPLHFDDLDSIDRYLNWWNGGCDYKEAAYRAPRLRSDGEGNVLHPKTKAHPSGIDGVDTLDEDPSSNDEVPPPAPVERQRAAPVGPRRAPRNNFRKHLPFPTLDAARRHYVTRFGSDIGFGSRLHTCKEEGPNNGKFMCSFSDIKTGVHSVEVVESHLGSGNLWGENQNKLYATPPLPQIGTVKVGYKDNTPTFYLCVSSLTDFDL
jgi:hypothetical protein